MSRHNGRKAGELRPVKVTRSFTKHAPGSVLMQMGDTHVLCTASLIEGVPKWREGEGQGWITAEYDMLPASTHTRRNRNRTKVDGRTQEIQRLVGRTMRSAVDLSRLGAQTILLDCDVLQADGGTRTAAITGGFIALSDAIAYGVREKRIDKNCITNHVAATSVGLVEGRVLVDLDYSEDLGAEVDLNLAMNDAGHLIEIQGTGEKTTFTREQLEHMLKLGTAGIRKLIKIQKEVLSSKAKNRR